MSDALWRYFPGSFPSLRLLWIIAWVCFAFVGYGEQALYIALAGHVGVKALCALIAYLRMPAVAFFTALGLSFYLMYLTVHLLGWGCWWLLFLSFLWAKVSFYDSGHIHSVEVGHGL